MTIFGGDRSTAVSLDLNPKGYLSGLQVAAKATGDFAKAAETAAGKHKKAFDDLGGSSTKAGLAIGALVGVAVYKFAEFDKSMSRAQAGTQATASQMGALREAAIQAGQATQYSATDAADAITAMGKAGVSVTDILGGGLTGAMSLAAAGELQVKDAAEIAATAMTQFGLAGRDLPHVADLLAAGAGKAQGDVTDLASALKYVGPVAHGMGVSIEQTTGALADFASQGIIGEQAGTSLRGVLSALTSPSAIASKELAALGISVFDASGKFIGLNGVAEQLQKGLGGLTEAERDNALGRIFGNEQITAARVLYQGGAKAIDEWTSRVNDSGYASRQAAILMNNLSGDVEQLKGSLETAFIGAGSGSNDGLRKLAQGATTAVNAFTSLPAPIQETTVVVGALAAGTLILGGALLKGVLAVKTMKTNLGELGVTGESVKGKLVGIGKIAGAVTTGLVAAQLASAAFSSGQVLPGVDTATKQLKAFADTGQATGSAVSSLGEDLHRLSEPGALGIGNSIEQLTGLSGALGSSIQHTQERLGVLDSALASQVSGGHAEDAAKQFGSIAQAADKQGLALADLQKLFPQYQNALDAAGSSTDAGSAASKVYTEALAAENKAAADATGRLTDLDQATSKVAGSTLDARQAARDYQAALDGATDSLKKNGRSLDITTPKGRENAAALDAIATAAQKQAQSILDTTGSEAGYRASLAKSRDALVKTAEKFGLSRDAAKKYADSVIVIPSSVTTTVLLNGIDEAQRQAANLQRALEAIRNSPALGSVSDILQRQGEHASAIAAPAKAKKPAASGPHIAGGILPGAPSPRDNMVITAASGEFVVNAKATSRNRGLLEAINAGVPGFATGGFVSTASPFGLSDVTTRYDAARPQPISTKDYLAAVNTSKNATLTLEKSERDLAYTRQHSPHNARALADAEDRLDKARRAQATARAAEASATARFTAPKGFSLGAYTQSLAATVAADQSFRRDLSIVAGRGGDQLATYLEGQGQQGIDLAHALARAKPADFKRVLALLKQLDPTSFAPAPAPTGPTTTTVKFAGGGPVPGQRGAGDVVPAMLTPGEWVVTAQAAAAHAGTLAAMNAGLPVRGATSIPATWVAGTRAAGSAATAGGTGHSHGGGSGPLVTVGTVQLLRGGPDDVANDIVWAMRSRGY